MEETQSTPAPPEAWASGEAYEPYVGRWSRLVAQAFIAWLGLPAGRAWLDVGCGTGALTRTILQAAAPRSVIGIDASLSYIAYARTAVPDPRAHFAPGDAQRLPFAPAAFDAAVSGLALNFIPSPGQAVDELVRMVRPGGLVAAYVWDYAGAMQLMRHFWNAAAALDPAAAPLDEGRRFPLCQPGPLASLFEAAGLRGVITRPIDIWTVFTNFDDYWQPFLGGQGPAPGYVRSLSQPNRAALRQRLRQSLPFALDGSIPLLARAWAVQGMVTAGRK